MIAGFIDRFSTTILRHRWLTLAIATLIVIVAGAGVPNLSTSGSYRVMFRDDNPHLREFDSLEDTYSASRSALIAVSPQEGTVFTRNTLAAIESLTEVAWQTPYSIRVISITNYLHSEAVGDDLTVEHLVEDATSLSDVQLNQVRNIAQNEPDLVGQLLSEDGRVAGLAINFALSEPVEPKGAEISEFLNNALDRAHADHPNLSFYLTGNVILAQTFEEAGATAERLVPVVFVLILSIMALLLRSLIATISLTIVIGSILLTTMGVAGWFGILLTPVTVSVPIIIMALGVAHAIHIVTIAQAAMRRGLERNAAILESLHDNFYPITLTSVTTSIGFLSLNISDSPPFHDLGNLVALGVMFTYLYSVTLLPALLSIIPFRAPRFGDWWELVLEHFGNFVVAHRKLFLWSGLVVVLALVSGISRNELSDNWLHHFDERYTFRTDTEFIINNMTGLDRLEYSLKSGREGGVTDPKYLQTVEAFAAWYRSQPEVLHVRSFSEIMKRVNKTMHGDDPAYYRIPDDPELAAQYFLLYELSLPMGADLNDRVDFTKSATRMTVVLGDTSTRDHLDIDARARGWLQANAPEIAAPASGFTMITAHLSTQNVRSMLWGTIIATSLITLILLVVLRSIRIGLICLVPNFIPAIMAFGLWGYLSGTIGLGASLVTAIAIGIIVDDTIHFLTKFMRLRRGGLLSTEAIVETFRTIGPALGATTSILVAGFLVFASSGYEPVWALGSLVAITISFALIADLTLLPALLMFAERKQT